MRDQSPRQIPYEAYGSRRDTSDELTDDVIVAIRYRTAATPGDPVSAPGCLIVLFTDFGPCGPQTKAPQMGFATTSS